MKKNTVLIIDDEFRVSKLIMKLIEWDRLNLECLDVLNDSSAAMQLIAKETPDIVITDIRMPKVTGLDIIKQYNTKCKFIVISGYKDFEYAYQAIKYGVSNYLLKPVNKVELNEILEKLSNEINQKQDKLNDFTQLKLQVAQSDKELKTNCFSTIIDNKNLDFPTSKNIFNQISNLKLFIIKLDYCKIMNKDKLHEEDIKAKILDIIYKSFSNICIDLISSIKPNLEIYTILNFSDEHIDEIDAIILSLFETINSELNKLELFYFTLGVIEGTFKQVDIVPNLNLCEKVINNRIKLGTNRIITNSDISLSSIEIESKYNTEIDFIFQKIFEGNQEEIKNSVFGLFSKLRELNDIDFSFFYEIPNFIFDKVFTDKFLNKGSLLYLKNNILDNINYIYSCRTMAQYLSMEFIQLSKEIENIKETKNVPIIKKVVKYIESNYQNKITLEDVSEEVNLNPVYLSSLFKKETDYNFTTYLTNFRINIAKKELIDSTDTIAAIAEKVGYKDSRYFSQTFKKTVGIKPALYRRMYAYNENKEG